jgi:hypothetical protein
MPYSELIGNKLNSRYKDSGTISQPWYPKDAIIFLTKLLQPTFHCYEWGAGVSTPWLAKRINSLISIEHTEEWFNKVNTVLEEENLSNTTLLHIPETSPNYIEHILTFPPNHFDAIFVDGAGGNYRISCALIAVRRLKPYGFLYVDDTKHFQQPPVLGPWAKARFRNRERTSCIYIKPRGISCDSL